MTNIRTLIIIPCFNEGSSIEVLMQDFLGIKNSCLGMEYETIVIDDCSQDSTYEVARRYSKVIKLVKNLGIGGAMQTGFKYAKNNDFDFCVQIDGDGQHPPSEILKLVQAYLQIPCSIIIGSRYLQPDTYRPSLARRFGSALISKFLNILFPNVLITDPASGMRLMDKKAIKFFAENYPHDFPEPISLAWAIRAGFSIREIPVQMCKRKHGCSTISGAKSMSYIVRVLSYIMLARFMRPLKK